MLLLNIENTMFKKRMLFSLFTGKINSETYISEIYIFKMSISHILANLS